MIKYFTHLGLLLSLSLLTQPLLAQEEDNDDEDTEISLFPNRIKAEGTTFHYNFTDFRNYTPILGPEATEALAWSNGVLSSTNASYWKKFNIQSMSGLGYWARRNDSVRYRSLNLFYSFLVGRSLINGKWLLVNPQIGLQGYGYFLRSSADDRIVPLTTLVNQPNLQMMMVQLQAIFDLQVAIKFPMPKDKDKKQLWITGKAGYFLPLNATPWIYSGRNRVTTDQPFTTNNLQVEVGILWVAPKGKRRFNLPDLLNTEEDRGESRKI